MVEDTHNEKMSIILPDHVVSHLKSQGLHGDPSEWVFGAKELSNRRAYVQFPLNVGFCVTGNSWELMPMAGACIVQGDYIVLGARKLHLEHIKGIEKMVWLFPDGSIQWSENGKKKVTCLSSGRTQKLLQSWIDTLQKKESSAFTKVMGQQSLIAVMKQSLVSWKNQLDKIQPSAQNSNSIEKR